MYKRTIISLIYIIVLINLFLPFVFAQEQPQQESQRIADVVHKIMQTSKKDIIEDVNRNMDDNVRILDERIMANNKVQFRKAIFALTGSLAVVIFGYAYVTNRISKRFDIMFFEKMIDSKLEKLTRLNYVMSEPSSYYTSVIKPQFEKRYVSPEKYFDGMSEQEQIKILQEQVKNFKKELDERGIKMEKQTFYKSIFKEKGKEEKPPKIAKPSFFNRFKKEEKSIEPKIKFKFDKKKLKMTVIILIVVISLVIYYFVNKYTDFSFVNLFNITGGT